MILLAAVFAALALPTPAQAVILLNPALHVYKPVAVAPNWSVPHKANTNDYVWQELACDGSDVLDGVGSVRIVGTMQMSGLTTPYQVTRWRIAWNTNLASQANWYMDMKPYLAPNELTQVVDLVQDLTPGQVQNEVTFGTSLGCSFTANNTPPASEGFISHRTASPDTVDSISLRLIDYQSGTAIPCDSTSTSGRVRIAIEVTNDQDTVLNFHVHQERSDGVATGPDQMGPTEDRRWWEMGFDSVHVLGGGATTTIHATTAFSTALGSNTFHAAQQTGPGQPKVETSCSYIHV